MNNFSRAYLIDLGRLRIVELFLNGKSGFNLGSGLIRFENKVNVDFERSSKTDADIIWDLSKFPYEFAKDESCEEIVFTECMEHLKKGIEIKVLKEIERILKPSGVLVMSVPNDNFVSNLLDVLYIFKNHRHYNEAQLRYFFSNTNLKIKYIFSSGSLPFGVLVFAYAINWIFGRRKSDLFKDLVTKSYNKILPSKLGGTLFAVAEKSK